MYAVRDAEGRFVGQARSLVTAHRSTRSRSHLGSTVNRAGGNPTKWEHVPEHDAWIKEFRFPAVAGWSKTTSQGVAVRRESKGSKDWRIDRTMFGSGWEAMTSTRYKSAAAAKRDADKIFKVFTAARAKGAAIDLDSMVGNDGQIRWHDTILGLSGIRREDFNMANRAGAVIPERHESQRSRHRKWTAYLLENGWRDYYGGYELRPEEITKKAAEAEAWRTMADEDAYYAREPRAYEGYDDDQPSDVQGRL